MVGGGGIAGTAEATRYAAVVVVVEKNRANRLSRMSASSSNGLDGPRRRRSCCRSVVADEASAAAAAGGGGGGRDGGAMRRTVVDLLQRTSDARDDDIMTFVRWVGGEGGGGVAGIFYGMDDDVLTSRVRPCGFALGGWDRGEGQATGAGSLKGVVRCPSSSVLLSSHVSTQATATGDITTRHDYLPLFPSAS